MNKGEALSTRPQHVTKVLCVSCIVQCILDGNDYA